MYGDAFLISGEGSSHFAWRGKNADAFLIAAVPQFQKYVTSPQWTTSPIMYGIFLAF